MPAAPTPSAAAPRVWTVFVVFVAALVGAVAAQAIAVMALAVWVAARGGDVRALPSLVTTPVAVVLLGLLGQLAFGAAALLAARFSPESAAWRLGLQRPALSGWAYPVLLVASLLPLVVGVGLSRALAAVVPPNPAGQQMYEQLTWPHALLFVVFVTLVPPVAEELLFRGYVQRRLLRRWSPWVAIPVTSLLFAVVHLDPHLVVVAFPLGLWLGWVAWRTGSVWPAVCCHAFVNFLWSAWRAGERFTDWLSATSASSTVALAVVGFGCLLLAIRAAARPNQALQQTGGA
jgi:membrane protease YdiL (CAAX protease family)